MSGWGRSKNNGYNHRNDNRSFQAPELVKIIKQIETQKTLPDKALESNIIQNYLREAKISNSQLRKWYEGILKIIEAVNTTLQKEDTNNTNLMQIELNIFKLMAQISYDINRNAKPPKAQYQEALLNTLKLLQELIKEYRLANNTDKQAKATKVKSYLDKFETFWMSLVAYQKGS